MIRTTISMFIAVLLGIFFYNIVFAVEPGSDAISKRDTIYTISDWDDLDYF